jgi:hypothetical protein
MRTPEQFIITPRTQKGDVYGTQFVFEADLPPQYTKFAWNFGDNSLLVYNQNTVNHIYKYPGIYTVGLSSWTDYGEFFQEEGTVDVDYVHRDSIRYTSKPDGYGIPGLSSSEAFVVQVTSAKIDQHISLALQSFNSHSVPHYSIPQKWRSITPTWRFTDSKSNVLDGPLVLDTVPIYNSENRIIAVKAEASFYYIDDLSTGVNPETDCPIMIVATLSTENFTYPKESIIYPYASYSNSEVSRAIVAWHINDVIPTNLKITENFLQDVYPTKWLNVPIPVMVTMQSDTTKIGTYSNATSNYVTTNLSYPRTNELGLLNPLNLRLSSSQMDLISGVHYKVEEVDKNGPLYFKATDEYGNVASGYVYTTITPLNALSSVSGKLVVAADTTTVNAGKVNTEFAFPIGFPIHSHVYISHPAKGTINRINRTTVPISCPNIEKYRSTGLLVEGDVSVIKVPTSDSTDLVNYSLSGGSGVYNLTFNPLINRLYAADVELNTISCYLNGITLLTSINLEHIIGNDSATPTHISVDRFNNLWVALFDDYRVLKFDANLNYLLSAFPLQGDFLNLEGYSLSAERFPTSKIQREDEEGFLMTEEPARDKNTNARIGFTDPYFSPIAETDKQSNVWVCYPNSVDSLLVKYDPDGNRMFRGDLPPNTIPISLSIGGENGVWAACKNTNNVIHLSSSGTFVSEVSGLLRPSYIAHDRKGNLWILHGYNLCSHYETTTRNLSTWRVSTTGLDENKNPIDILSPIQSYTDQDIEKAYYGEEIWGGLATDVFNRVWIIDSKSNKAIAFKPSDLADIITQPIIPGIETGPYQHYLWKIGDNFVTNIPMESVPSAQAGGDWTGNRWYQKYASGLNFYPIDGTSTPFTLYDINKSYQVAKVNETFDTAKYYKDLAYSEVLKNNTKLFDEFFTAVVGDGNPNNESIGSVVYEKIANFVSNNGDCETAETNALESLAKSLDIECKDFGEKFPVAVNRLINLFSVPKHRLYGTKNFETDPLLCIGEQLSFTDSITADQWYLLKDLKYAGDPLIIYANEVEGRSVYPISLFTSNSLLGDNTSLSANYAIFRYDTQLLNEKAPYTGNLIDWSSKYTTISQNLSSYEEWYGEQGLIETMFNNLLTKQLYPQ